MSEPIMIRKVSICFVKWIDPTACPFCNGGKLKCKWYLPLVKVQEAFEKEPL